MIPIRVLLVEDALPVLRQLTVELEGAGFETYSAASAAAGMLSLARYQPDVLLVNPQAGRSTPWEWIRAIERYRNSRSLGVLVMAGRIPPKDRKALAEVADLGIIGRPVTHGAVQAILLDWVGHEESRRTAGRSPRG